MLGAICYRVKLYDTWFNVNRKSTIPGMKKPQVKTQGGTLIFNLPLFLNEQIYDKCNADECGDRNAFS